MYDDGFAEGDGARPTPTLDLTSPRMLDSLRGLAVCLDAANRVLAATPSLARVLGERPGSLVGHHFCTALVPGHQRHSIRQSLEHCRRSGKSEPLVAFQSQHRQSLQIHWRWSLVDSAGTILGCGQDVTQTKRLEEKLLAAHSRLDQLLTVSPVVLYGCCPWGEREQTFMSDNVRSILGYAPEDFAAEGFWRQRVHPQDIDAAVEAMSAICRREHFRVEYRMRHAHGHHIWIRDEARLVRDFDGRPLEVSGCWHDVTEVRQIRHRLSASMTAHDGLRKDLAASHQRCHQLSHELMQAHQLVGQQVAMDIHDGLGQQLAALKLQLKCLSSAATGDMPTALAGPLEMLEIAIRQAGSLTEGLAGASLKHRSLPEAVDAMAHELSDTWKVRIVTHLDQPNRLGHVSSSTSWQLVRMVRELAINALKHARPQRVSVRLRRSPLWLAAMVTDDGEGFVNAQPARTAGGLGLAAIRHRLELLGGRLIIHSRHAGGSIVTVALPASSLSRQESLS